MLGSMVGMQWAFNQLVSFLSIILTVDFGLKFRLG